MRFLWTLSRGARQRLLKRSEERVKRQGLTIELSRATIASPPYHEESCAPMTSASIPGIYIRSNTYYSVLSVSCRLSPYHGRALRGSCQLLIYPIAYHYSLGVHQLHAIKAAFGCRAASCSMKPLASRLLSFFRKLIQSFPWTYGAYGKRVPKDCRHTTGMTLRELFPPLASRRRRYSLGVGEE